MDSNYTFTALIIRDKNMDGRLVATFPAIPEVEAQGNTDEEVTTDAQNKLRYALLERICKNRKIPVNRRPSRIRIDNIMASTKDITVSIPVANI